MGKKKKTYTIDATQIHEVAKLLEEHEREPLLHIAKMLGDEGYRQTRYCAELAIAMYKEKVLTISDGSRSRTLGGHFFLIAGAPGRTHHIIKRLYDDKWRYKPLKNWQPGDGPQLRSE